MGVSAHLAHPSNCIHPAEKNFKRSKVLGGLAASASERPSRKVQNGSASAVALQKRPGRVTDANPAPLRSPTHTTIDHVTSKAHTGNLTCLTLTLRFHHTGSSVVLNPTCVV